MLLTCVQAPSHKHTYAYTLKPESMLPSASKMVPSAFTNITKGRRRHSPGKLAGVWPHNAQNRLQYVPKQPVTATLTLL